MNKFKRIFLVGFRATGKSTLGKLLADKLKWSFVDLDFLISQQEGVDIGVLTKNGTDWGKFRKIENEALKDVSIMENVVISCGGGVGVNDIVDEKSKKTLGQLNQETLKNEENIIILLTSEDKIIKKRLEVLFRRKKIMPFINANNALKPDEKKEREELIKKQVDDSMHALTKRKTLYQEFADVEIDTSNFIFPKKLVNLNIVIGDPVSHSLSPSMHNLGYLALGVDKDNLFISIRVKKENLRKALYLTKILGINGISVTIPHKETVIKYLDSLEKDAGKIGSVNTILCKEGKLIGFNTDWIGAVNALKQKTEISGKKVAIIGAGGAAKAIVFGIIKEGGKVKVFNRTKEKAEEIAEIFDCEFAGMDEISEIKDFDIIINSTSVGMGNNEKSPIDKDLIQKDQVILDAVYSPKATKLLKDAKEKGATVIYGTDMLLFQGVEQFKLYTGLEAPIKKMRNFLNKK